MKRHFAIPALLGILGSGLSTLAWVQEKAADADAAAPAAPVVLSKADNAWVLVCAALVILMSIPGLALFYGGLVRSKNMLSVLMQVFVTFSLISVL